MKKLIGSLGLPQNASGRWKSFEGSTMDIELPLDVKEFLKLLNENGVRVLPIGGVIEFCCFTPTCSNERNTLKYIG
jgi:Fe-S oxidoreductase